MRSTMPRKTSLTPPLLYVIQPELQEKRTKVMQSRYYTKTETTEEMIQIADDLNQELAEFNADHDLVETETTQVEKLEKVGEYGKGKSAVTKEPVNKELMKFFLQRLNPQFKVNSMEIPSPKDQSQKTNILDEEQVQIRSEIEEEKINESAHCEDVRRLITRLSRYPDFVTKPLCEAIIRGEKVLLQIDKKRGDRVRVIINSKKQMIDIHDISDLSVL